MNVKILYFGNIIEITKQNDELLELNETINNINKLISHLSTIYPDIEKQEYQISCCQKLVSMDYKINDGDEIALLPPFSGG